MVKKFIKVPVLTNCTSLQYYYYYYICLFTFISFPAPSKPSTYLLIGGPPSPLSLLLWRTEGLFRGFSPPPIIFCAPNPPDPLSSLNPWPLSHFIFSLFPPLLPCSLLRCALSFNALIFISKSFRPALWKLQVFVNLPSFSIIFLVVPVDKARLPALH